MELAIQQNLTQIEESELSRLELIIEKNLFSFYEVGSALLNIRDSGLYKTYGTFERYCKERWEFQRAHAYRLIASAKLLGFLSPIGDIQPTHETQIRPLIRLEPDQQIEAWKKAVETAAGGKVTAK